MYIYSINAPASRKVRWGLCIIMAYLLIDGLVLHMNNSEKIGKLVKKCGDSVRVLELTRYFFNLIPTIRYHGWLWIKDAGDYWEVTLANSQFRHQFIGLGGGGKLIMAEFLKNNGKRRINNSPRFSPFCSTGASEGFFFSAFSGSWGAGRVFFFLCFSFLSLFFVFSLC